MRLALDQARAADAVGDVPVGAVVVDADGVVLGSGHNQRVQGGNPALHGETAAFLNAGRQKSYRKTTLATTLSPCWYCSGLVRQFNIGRVIVGENQNFFGGQDWLVENGTSVTTVNDPELIRIMAEFIDANPELWNEDIGEE
jgi:cytosine deaminase